MLVSLGLCISRAALCLSRFGLWEEMGACEQRAAALTRLPIMMYFDSLELVVNLSEGNSEVGNAALEVLDLIAVGIGRATGGIGSLTLESVVVGLEKNRR